MFLVGAGPGDPGLMTIKGLDCLRQADVIVYDRLLDQCLLEVANPRSKRIYVGKSSGYHSIEQDEINQLLIEKAQQGKKVVRLKGGDPFVLGRGGEEAEALALRQIPFEIIPGITSAVAVPAYAGIPVTHRGLSSSFTVVTGHRAVGRHRPKIDWEKLGADTDTLIFLMGVGNLDYLIKKLIKAGKSPSTPVAIIERGTSHRQRTLVGTLENIVSQLKQEGLQSPAVVVIGKVVKLRKNLRWFDIHPLFGKRILVTRAKHQAKQLSQSLLRYGALPVELPGIKIQSLSDPSEMDKAISNLRGYQWIVFTSVNGVSAFFQRLNELNFDSRWLYGLKIGAIGPATARALGDKGLIADCIPKRYTTKGLLAELTQRDIAGKKVLLPRADIASKELTEGIQRLGAKSHEVTAYRTIRYATGIAKAKELLLKGEIDIILFTSPSTVNNLLGAFRGDRMALEKALIVCIGPQTASAVKKAGLIPKIVARKHTIPGILEAMEKYFQGGRK